MEEITERWFLAAPRASETQSAFEIHKWRMDGNRLAEVLAVVKYPATGYKFRSGYLVPVPPAELVAEIEGAKVPVDVPLGWRNA